MELDQDAQLMLAVKRGDRQAFGTLFRRYARPLHNFVRRFVGNPAVAEELVQEIFFKIYRAAEGYEPKGRFSTFLYRVATNHCLNEVRRPDYKNRFESIEQLADPGVTGVKFELPDDQRPSAENLFDGQRLAAKIQEVLQDLPDKQRAALLLHRIDGLSYQEIAEALELTLGAVKSLIHRAKKTLKQKLESYEKQGSPSRRSSSSSGLYTERS